MSIIQSAHNDDEELEMRKVFCDTLMELAEKDDKVLVVDADLMTAMGTKPFAARYPERTVNCGVQEANMMGVAAGLSVEGFKPFVHSFSSFSVRRALDQIWISCAYAKTNVKIIGSDPGITAALNGGTHTSFEDLGIMRMIPGSVVIEPTDSVVLADLLKQSNDVYGIFYFRLLRRNAVKIYEKGSRFEIGKSVKLREGKDITIISAGICVGEALRAHDILKDMGISASVLDMIFYKPIDREAIISEAKETGLIVTCENHNYLNGIGSAVAEIIAEEAPAKLYRMGVREEFGEVGPVSFLRERFGLTSGHIVDTARKAFARKQ